MAKITVKILKDIDSEKWAKMVRDIKAAGRHVNVGYPAGKEEADGTPVALIAAAHNFGVPDKGLPERPFMTQAVMGAQQKIVTLNRDNLLKVLHGDMTTDAALGQLGAFVVGAIQREIKGGNFVALKDETIERKHSSKPLIDTGQMLQSTTYVIEEGTK